MNWILKNKNKSSETLLVVLFLVFNFLLLAPDNVKAAAGICEGASDGGAATEKTCECFNGSTSLKLFPAGQDISDSSKTSGTGFCTQEVCMIYCKDKYPTTTSVKFDGGTLGTSSIKNSSSAVAKAPTASEAAKGLLYDGMMAILVKIQALVGWLFAIAATLFAWVIDPKNISGPNGMLNKPAVKDVWIMVRDLLNMTFILVLLFAAFCTIFQVEKWALKKVWLNILINALLVNFSYPIARFFIDISNVAFYYFVNNLFSSTGTVTGSGIFAMFGSSSGIGEMLMPKDYMANDMPYLIASIIVIFIMGMTLMVIAGLFVVRLVALMMLVMFSPIGFVGYIFPGTAKHADKWWSQLFEYSFFAPIMIFIMAISLRIMEAMKNENFQAMVAGANANTPADQANWIANAAFFAIPIIILWAGIGMAKSSGGAMASEIVDRVKNGGKWLANAPGKYSGVYGATKKATEDFNKKGKLFGMKVPLMGSAGREAREARWSAGLTGGRDGYNDARRDQIRKEASEMRENWKKAGGASSSELEHALGGGQAEKMAAALEMSEKNGFKLNDTDTAAQVLARYQRAAGAMAGDKVLQNNFNDKVKEKHIKLVIQDEIGASTDPALITATYKKHLDKMNASKLAGQKGLADHRETAEYLSGRQATGNRSDIKFVSNVLGGMTTEDRAKLHSHTGTGLHV